MLNLRVLALLAKCYAPNWQHTKKNNISTSFGKKGKTKDEKEKKKTGGNFCKSSSLSSHNFLYPCALKRPHVVHETGKPAGLLLVGDNALAVIGDLGVGDLGGHNGVVRADIS